MNRIGMNVALSFYKNFNKFLKAFIIKGLPGTVRQEVEKYSIYTKLNVDCLTIPGGS